jgi:hypothetical protein
MTDDDIADEFLTHVLMKETADYVRRGRQFRLVLLPELNDRWIAAFRRVFFSGAGGQIEKMDDLASELRLRNLDPPYERVPDEVAQLVADLKKMGPESASPEIIEAIGNW